jgi:hypothetical protein
VELTTGLLQQEQPLLEPITMVGEPAATILIHLATEAMSASASAISALASAPAVRHDEGRADILDSPAESVEGELG